jgi:hypothetical protein
MSRLLRPKPDRQILDLARQLAEDYESIPLPEVSRVVRAAAASAGGDEWSGTSQGIPTLLAVIEQVAREDLDAARVAIAPVSSRRPVGSARPAVDRRTRRLVAE